MTLPAWLFNMGSDRLVEQHRASPSLQDRRLSYLPLECLQSL